MRGLPGQNPYVSALQNVERAVERSRQQEEKRYEPSQEGYLRKRYEVLKRNPEMLRRFVSEATGVQDPYQIEAGAQDYLRQMGERYGN